MQRTASPRGSRTVGKAKPAAVIETLADLTPDPRNARRHNPRNVGMLEKALGEVGAARSIVIDEHGVVLAGNATIEAAGRAGIERVQVVDADGETIIAVRRTGLTAKQKTRLALYDNRTAELADWDADVIADLLATERELLDGLFADDELAELLDDLGDPETVDAEPQIDRAAELNKKWQVQAGDLWRIGEHRLLCGDSTKREDVARVMGGEKAQLVFTDPPYGVGKAIENDDLVGAEFEAFNSTWVASLPFDANCGLVCYHSTRTFPSALSALVSGGWKFERMLWYYRPDKFPTHSWKHWMMVSQSIMLFSVGDVEYAETESDQDCYRLTATGLGEGSGHPTEKMAGHCARVMQHYSAKTVYDPFLGSGTTMVACENLHRKCRGIELSPDYCAVILERMATAFPALAIERA